MLYDTFYSTRFIEVYSAVIATITTLTILTGSVVLPLLLKKYNDNKTKLDSAQQAADEAFKLYYSDESKKNDFDWYYAEICAIQKRYGITSVRCLNCKKITSCTKYNDWFKDRLREIPEVNNFCFKAGKLGFKIELSVLLCYNCVKDKKVEPFIDKTSIEK
ncbi:hypothetical protein SGLAD_v1c07780 [Spiroplasma gladiatoris]|uniref:Transmembrane protein n=1 Tax=Spiroplasma gladiatoris TaxID=2143 RepID=A0A4P7AI82_9MOLU|nr:hypothetical protein [Spiroplasma gladiatoris]QBQ07977.1 hypothetical protein SGLAD_v1c07780 [Spiroplasma gladiatoris]